MSELTGFQANYLNKEADRSFPKGLRLLSMFSLAIKHQLLNGQIRRLTGPINNVPIRAHKQ